MPETPRFPLLAACSLVCACLDPTQATLRLSTDAPCGGTDRAAGSLFGIYIGAANGTVSMREGANVEAHACNAGDIGTLVLFPEDGANEATAVVVGVLGSREPNDCLAFADDPSLDGTECIVARRRIGFVDHRPLEVPVVLYTACAGVRCGEGFTCQPGAPPDAAGQPCVSATARCRGDGTCEVETPPAQGGGGGGEGGQPAAWTVEEIADSTGARHVFGVDQALLFSVPTVEQNQNCADIRKLESGVITPAWKVCQGAGVHQAALHVTGSPPAAFADVGDTAFVVDGASADWTLSRGTFTDLYLRDKATAYAAFASEVHRKPLPGGSPELVLAPLGFGGMRHIWVHERSAPADDIVFFVGDSACEKGSQGPGSSSCTFAVGVTLESTPFADVWGAGGRVVTVAGPHLVTVDADTPSFALPLAVERLPMDGGEEVDLARVFAVEPDGVVWVAGRSPPQTGALYVARGEPINSGGHTWTEHRYAEVAATPVSLWARSTEAFAAVDSGRLFRIQSPL